LQNSNGLQVRQRLEAAARLKRRIEPIRKGHKRKSRRLSQALQLG